MEIIKNVIKAILIATMCALAAYACIIMTT